LALFSDNFLISIEVFLSNLFTALIISSISAFGEIKNQVWLFIIDSLSPHSLTHITGFQHAIDSTGLIQKSSSTGI
jgi:hypothetical protein